MSLSPLGGDMLPEPPCAALYHIETHQPSLFCVHDYCVHLFDQSRMVLLFICLRITQRFQTPVCFSKGGLRRCAGRRVDVLCSSLWRHLYDPRLIDDASGAVSFFYNSNDPCLVALSVFRRFDLCTEAGSLLSGQTDEQAP